MKLLSSRVQSVLLAIARFKGEIFQIASIVLAGVVVFAVVAIIPMERERIISASFDGTRQSYAEWIDGGHGEFNINDDDGDCSPLVNDAFLSLMLEDESAKRRYHDRMMSLYSTDFDFDIEDNGQRQFSDVLESYIFMREETIFSLDEQVLLENWFLETANDLDSHESTRYQGVGAGMGAVLGYVLYSTNQVGKPYGDNTTGQVKRWWDYAMTGQSFDTAWSPPENSAHYVSYLMMSSLRIATYVNKDAGTRIIDTSQGKSYFKQLLEWIMKVYPHNGNGLAYGGTYGRDHLRPIFNVLHAGAYFMKEYDSELAGNCKWLATKMFRYSVANNKETTWTNHEAGRFEANPMYIWMYADDAQRARQPSVSRFGSGPVVRNFVPVTSGSGWDDYGGLPEKFDKIVLRDGWGSDSFYIILDAAPDSGKNHPYANSIQQLVLGEECFVTDHTSEGNPSRWRSSWWEERNVASDFQGLDKNEMKSAELVSFNEDDSVAVSVTRKFGWTRTIKLYMSGDRRIEVTDELPSEGAVYWHFQGTAKWESDGVVLDKGGEELHVSWTGASEHRIESTVDDDGRCCGWGWGYVGENDIEVKLSGRSTFVTTFRPESDEIPSSPGAGYFDPQENMCKSGEGQVACSFSDVTLSEGWNMVSLPSDLSKDANTFWYVNQMEGAVDIVSLWDNSRSRFQNVVLERGELYGNATGLTPVKPLLVRSKNKWDSESFPYPSGGQEGDLEITLGWSGIVLREKHVGAGVPSDEFLKDTLPSLASEVGYSVAQIARFNSSSHTWETRVYDHGKFFGNPFQIMPDTGYFLCLR